MPSWASGRRTSRASRLALVDPRAGSPPAAAVAVGLAAGASCSLLGFLGVATWWPPRLIWAIRALAPPGGGWFSGWSSSARTVASLQGAALDTALWVAAGLALLVLAAGLLHLCLSLLTEAAARRSEWALRAALGATAGRLRRERALQGVALAGIAGSLGLVLGRTGRGALGRLIPPDLSTGAARGSAAVGLPAALLLAAASLALVGIALVGGPRRDLLRDPARRLAGLVGPRTGGGSGIRGGAEGPAGWLLAAAQVGAAVVVAVAALLLARGAPRAAADAHAYPDAVDTLVLRVALPPGADRGRAWSAMRRRLLSLPGVAQAAVSSPGALLGLGPVDDVAADCPWCVFGGTPTPISFGRVRYLAVGPGFFDLLGSESVPGAAAREPPANGRGTAFVDPVFAARLFQGGEPSGRSVWLADQRPLLEAGVRVAGTAAAPHPIGVGAGGRPVPTLYLSTLDHPPEVADVALRVGHGLDPRTLRGPALGNVSAAAPGSRTEVLGTLAELLDGRVATIRWLGRLTIGFAVLCGLLAFYSVTATLGDRIRAREAELALRRAVGARRRDIARLVTADAGRLVAAGTAAGCVVAASLDRGLPLLVRGVTPLPAGTVLAIAGSLACAAVGAAALSARRVTGRPPGAAGV
jgi:hypothetical protein